MEHLAQWRLAALSRALHFLSPFYFILFVFHFFSSLSVYFSSVCYRDGVLARLNIEKFMLVVSYTSFRAVIINCSITRFTQS